MASAEYQPNLGISVYPPYFNLKDKCWRFPEWSLVAKEDQLKFWDAIKELMTYLPSKYSSVIKDIEIVGSYAYGCANTGSDIDLNIVISTGTATTGIEDTATALSYAEVASSAGWTNARDFKAKVFEVSNTLKLRIDIAIGPSAKKLACYSFYEDAWYGKKPGELIERTNYFDTKTKTFIQGKTKLGRYYTTESLL